MLFDVVLFGVRVVGRCGTTAGRPVTALGRERAVTISLLHSPHRGLVPVRGPTRRRSGYWRVSDVIETGSAGEPSPDPSAVPFEITSAVRASRPEVT